MINTISYLVPFLGLLICVVVVLTSSIDTRCPIRIVKMVLWMAIWTIVAFYDYPYDAIKALSIMFVRLFMLTVNILYVVEAILYPQKRFKKKRIKTKEAL